MRRPTTVVVVTALLGALAGCAASAGPADGDASLRGRDARTDGNALDRMDVRDAADVRDVDEDDVPPVGTACSRDRDCAATPGTVCVADPATPVRDLELMGLGCGALRPGRAPLGAPCARNAECDRGLCAFAGSCVRPCADDQDCDAEQFCTEVYVQTGAAAMQSLHACVARVDAPPGVTVSPRRSEHVRTGAHTAVAVPGVAAPATTGLTIFNTDAAAARITAFTLTTRDAVPATLFDASTLTGIAPVRRNSVSYGRLPMTVLIPNGPESVVTAEGYTLELMAQDSAVDLAATTLSRGAPGAVLDVNLYYIGVSGLVPTGDRGPGAIRIALGELEAALQTAGIALGSVRQFRLVGALAERFAVLDRAAVPGARGEEGELFLLSAGAGRPCVNVFFVRSIEMALGISGGIPGTQTAHGTRGAGVALSYDLLGSDLGRAMTHELGHFLGLFHTTELTGVALEPLTDTPVCDATHDADGDGFVAPFECVGFGADNVMFWSPSETRLSPQQRDVIRRAMVLR
jgi:hypothetical protein